MVECDAFDRVCAHSGTAVMCENDAAGELAVFWLPVHGSCQGTVWCMHVAMRRLGSTPIEPQIHAGMANTACVPGRLIPKQAFPGE